MIERCPLPARASFRDLLRDLVDARVNVRSGSAQHLTPERPAYLAGYRFDDGRAATAVVCDASLSFAVASALAAMSFERSPAEVADPEEGLDADLRECLREVVNVTAKLFNSTTTPHVRLAELLPVPGEVPGDLAAIATEPRRREDWQVCVDGYGEGTLTLLG